jgi:hypothetical protein
MTGETESGLLSALQAASLPTGGWLILQESLPSLPLCLSMVPHLPAPLKPSLGQEFYGWLTPATCAAGLLRAS